MRIRLSALEQVIANGITSRSQLLKMLTDPRRDIYEECGWAKAGVYNAQLYQDTYETDPVANRVVTLLPEECWVVQPDVYETEKDRETEFEKAWDTLGATLRGEGNYLKDNEGKGNPIWGYLKNLDIQSGIGRYGVMLLGLDDGEDLSQPVKKGKRRLNYLRVFPEIYAQINAMEGDAGSPRFGYPLSYSLSLSDPREALPVSGQLGLTMANVHWSRIIHVADNIGTSEVVGMSRMRPVWNALYDLQKIYGAGCEGYYKSGFPGLSLETNPALGGEVDIDPSDLKDQVENYQNGLQRFLALVGMTAKTLSPNVTDPTPYINACIQRICIPMGCPQRIFLGSERGELASAQDKGSWDERVAGRRTGHVTNRVIGPFVNRLISLGILPRPKDGYFIGWPSTQEMTEGEKVDIAVKKTQAASTYVGGNLESLYAPIDFHTRIMGETQEEAEAIIDNAIAAQEEMKAQQEEEGIQTAEEQGTNGQGDGDIAGLTEEELAQLQTQLAGGEE